MAASGGGGGDASAALDASLGESQRLLRKKGSLRDAIFGVLYTLSKEKAGASWKAGVLSILVHFLQLIVTVITNHFSWDFQGAWWATAVQATDVTNLLQAVGYKAFAGLFWAQLCLVLVSVAICLFVAYNFKTDNFPYVWPIKVARFLVAIFVKALYISVTAVFLMSIRCDSGSSTLYFFPDQKCNRMPHLAAVVVAVPAAFAIISFGYFIAVGESELDPYSKDIMAVPFSQCEVQLFIAQTCVDFLDIFMGGTTHRSTLAVLLAALMCFSLFSSLRHTPFLNVATNVFKAGLYGILAWSSIVLVVLELTVSYGPDPVKAARTLSAVCGYGLAPAFVLAGLAMYLRIHLAERAAQDLCKRVGRPALEAMHSTLDARKTSKTRGAVAHGPIVAHQRAVDAVRYAVQSLSQDPHEAPAWTRPDPPPRFRSARHAEAVALRCLRATDAVGNLLPDYLVTALYVLRVGQRQFPQSARLRMLCGNFLHHTGQTGQAAAAEFAAAKHMPLNMDLQFQCFCHAREAAQGGGSENGSDGALDLVAYVEFQNNLRAVQRMQDGAMSAMRDFWGELLNHEGAKITQLCSLARSLSAMENKAQALYTVMLERFTANVNLIRLYAMFLARVKLKPGRALRLLEKADRIEDENAKQRMLTQDVSGKTTLGEDSGALVVTNERGEIQITNRELNRLFGYQMGELLGRNVSVLMPRPFSHRHNVYLASFLRTRQSRILGTHRLLVAMRKDGSTFPVKARITHVSQDGVDRFMASMAPISHDTHANALYLTPDGTVLAAGAGVTSLLGWSSKDLTGQPLSAVMLDNPDMDRSLSMLQDSLAADPAPPRGPRQGGRASMDVGMQSRASMDWALLAPRTASVHGSALPKQGDRHDPRQSSEMPRADQAAGARRAKAKPIAVQMRHKWLRQAVDTDAALRVAGYGAGALLVLSFTATPEQAGVVVFDRQGALSYINAPVASWLGYSPSALMRAHATIGHLLPRGMGHFHAQRLLRSPGGSADSPPCRAGCVVPMRGRGGAEQYARLTWREHRQAGEVFYVCTVRPAAAMAGARAWGFRGRLAAVAPQGCLRVAVDGSGRIVGVYGGTGADPTAPPGAVVRAGSLVGRGVVEVVDVLGAAAATARQFSGGAKADEVALEALEQLAQSGAAIRAALVGSGMPAPVRLRVLRASEAGADLAAAGVPGVVFLAELWSAHWLWCTLSVSPVTGAVAEAGPGADVLWGYPAHRMVGQTLGALLVTDESAAVDAVLSGASSRAEVWARHASGSRFRVLLTGPGDAGARRRRRVVLMVSAAPEMPEKSSQALHRMQVVLDQHSAPQDLSLSEDGSDRDSHGAHSAEGGLGETEDKDEDAGGGGGPKSDGEGSTWSDGDSDSDVLSMPDDGASGDGDSALSGEGVSRRDFRRSKQLRATAELLERSRAASLLRTLVPSVQAIMIAVAVVHVVLFGVTMALVSHTRAAIATAETAGSLLTVVSRVSPLARRMYEATHANNFTSPADLPTLRGRMQTDADELNVDFRQAYARPVGARLRGLLQSGISFQQFWDVDYGQGAGPQDVAPGPVESMGLLQLTSLAASRAQAVALMSDAQLASAPHTSRLWFFTVEGTRDALLPVESSLLADAYRDVARHLNSLTWEQLILGMVQAVGMMPLCICGAYLHVRRLTGDKAKVFSVFVSIPRPIAYLAAAEPGGGEDPERRRVALARLEALLMEDERRTARRMARVMERGGDVPKAMRRVGGADVQLKNDEWRLQMVVLRPLVALMVLSLGLHIAGHLILRSARDPILAMEDSYSAESDMVGVRFWANELAFTPTPETNPWGLTNDQIRSSLSAAAGALSDRWTQLLLGGGQPGSPHHRGIQDFGSRVSAALDTDQCGQSWVNCGPPGSLQHALMSDGLSQTVRNVVDRAQLMASTSDASLADGTLASFVWDASQGYLEPGTRRLTGILRDLGEQRIQIAVILEGCLLALNAGLLLWVHVMVRPEVRAGHDELKWAARLLCRLPESMNPSQLVWERVVIVSTDRDSLHSESEPGASLLARVRDRLSTAWNKMLMGSDYADWVQFKNARAKATKEPTSLGKWLAAVKHTLLRPFLGPTYAAWKELEDIYKRGRAQEFEVPGTEGAAQGAGKAETGKAAIPTSAANAKPGLGDRERPAQGRAIAGRRVAPEPSGAVPRKPLLGPKTHVAGADKRSARKVAPAPESAPQVRVSNTPMQAQAPAAGEGRAPAKGGRKGVQWHV